MLSRTSEYALRALIHLAEHQTEWPIAGSRIAAAAGVPSKYLSKILGDLVRAHRVWLLIGASDMQPP